MNQTALKEIVNALLSVLRGSVRANSSATYLAADLRTLGVADDKAERIGALWKAALGDIKRAAVGHTLMVNELVDIDWSFGVTAANSELDKVGDCFLQLRLALDDGGGRVRRVPMELTLPQFYSLVSELESAKAHLESAAQ